MGFALEITKDMKRLNLVKERVKPESKGLGLHKEGKKKEGKVRRGHELGVAEYHVSQRTEVNTGAGGYDAGCC